MFAKYHRLSLFLCINLYSDLVGKTIGKLHFVRFDMSHIMRKPAFAYAKTKAQNCAANQFFILYIDILLKIN